MEFIMDSNHDILISCCACFSSVLGETFGRGGEVADIVGVIVVIVGVVLVNLTITLPVAFGYSL